MTFISSAQQQDDSIKLYKYVSADLKSSNQQTSSEDERDDNTTTICFLDLETTGTYKLKDKIIEIAMRTVVIHRETGKLLSVTEEYESLQDPNMPISEEATLINGITNEMVMGKEINWQTVES